MSFNLYAEMPFITLYACNATQKECALKTTVAIINYVNNAIKNVNSLTALVVECTVIVRELSLLTSCL